MESMDGLVLISILAGWVLLCVLAAKIASSKGREGINYFLLAFFLSPLVGILAAAVATPNQKGVDENKLAAGGRRCPFCAEVIRREAVVCRFCGRDLPKQEAPTPPSPVESQSAPATAEEPETNRPAPAPVRPTRPPVVLPNRPMRPPSRGGNIAVAILTFALLLIAIFWIVNSSRVGPARVVIAEPTAVPVPPTPAPTPFPTPDTRTAEAAYKEIAMIQLKAFGTAYQGLLKPPTRTESLAKIREIRKTMLSVDVPPLWSPFHGEFMAALEDSVKGGEELEQGRITGNYLSSANRHVDRLGELVEEVRVEVERRNQP